jgi:hypothetical protein
MAVLTGSNGALRYRGTKITKVREWSLDINRDALEDSCLGTYDRTYVMGMRGASGSATVMYDPEDTAVRLLLNSIFENSGGDGGVEFVLEERSGKALRCNALVTSVGASVSVGAIQAFSVAFQVSGAVDGGF